MCENMLRGSSLAVVDGPSVRRDTAGISITVPLPCDAGTPYPIKVDPSILDGLMKAGIAHVSTTQKTLGITTQTGLVAQLPFVPDPHRSTQLRLSQDGERIEPERMQEWLEAVVTVGRALGRSNATVYTYRSFVFAHNTEVMLASRLSKAWPIPCSSNPQMLAQLQRAVSNECIVDALCNQTEVLVKTAQGGVFRGESLEHQIPQSPWSMLVKYRSHVAPSIQAFPGAGLRVALEQLLVAASARGPSSSNVFTQWVGRGENLRIKLGDDHAHVVCNGWNLGQWEVPLRSLASLVAIAGDDGVDIVCAPEPGKPSPLVFRAGRYSCFMAANARE